MSEQDYIPGTQVIKNLIDRDHEHPFGTTHQLYLDQAENLFVSDRLKQLRRKPITDAKLFSFAHMRQIHRHLFQDVYAWAGEPRRAAMTKLGTAYAEPSEMNALLREQYTSLAEQSHLQGISDRKEFTDRLAGFWAEINHGHAFREGNTRSQTVFFEQLAHHAGWNLDVSRLAPHHPRSAYKEFVGARFEHQRVRGTVAVGETGHLRTLSALDAARDLADVLHKLVEPDESPEGCLRRGVAEPGAVQGAVIDQTAAPVPTSSSEAQGTAVLAHLTRHPELRSMTLDPYGLADEVERSAGVDYEL